MQIHLDNILLREMNLFIIALKTILSTALLFCGLTLATLLKTGSFEWLYSMESGTSPFLTCPSTAQIAGTSSVLDGSACELRFAFTSFVSFDSSVRSAFRSNNALTSGGLQCFQGGAYSECSSNQPCKVMCYSAESCSTSFGTGSCTANGILWGSDFPSSSPALESCSQSISLSGIRYNISGASISAEPLCGPDLIVTPGLIMTIRGEIVAISIIGLLVLVSLCVRSKVAPATRHKASNQKGIMIAKASAYELRTAVEAKWDSSVVSPSNAPIPQRVESKQTAVHPAKFFAASSWKYRVRVMHAMLRKRKSRLRKAHIAQATLSSILLVLVSMLFSLLLLQTLPDSYPLNVFISSVASESTTGHIGSIWSMIYTGSPVPPGVWIDGLVVSDIAVEFLMLLVATVAGLRWKPIPPEKELARLSQTGVCEEACLVLLVSAGTCLRTSGKDKLVAAIQTGIRKLKVGAVFVVDMGGSNAPLDDTWKICKSVDPNLVHYVYLPDNNKRLGEFWLSEIWIPFLFKSGRIGRLYKQMLVIDLDSIAITGKSINLIEEGILSKLLMLSDGNIDDNCGTVVLMPVKSSVPGWMGKWESNRLEQQYYQRMMEAATTGGCVTSFTPSGNASIVDRRTLEVLAPSDPTQLALAAIRKRGKVQIATPSGLQQLAVHNSLYDFTVEQSRTIPNSLSLIKELILAPSSFTNGQSLLAKLFILFGPILGLAISVLRPLILGTLLFRDPIALFFMFAAFWALSMLTNCMHGFNQWRFGRSKDLSISLGSILTYPIYQIYLGALSLGLIVGGATYGRLNDELERPSVGSHKELYPCLPHPDVDWFTCWKTSDATRLSVLNTAVESDSPRLLSFSNDSLV
jgi:hypothetical protein